MADTSTNKDATKDESSGEGGLLDGIWKFLTESGKWFNANLYETVHSAKNYKLKNIHFLPLYVEQHVANDFYSKMFSQLYPDPPTSDATHSSDSSVLDKVSNAAGATVSKVANTVANQITSTANYARNLVSTLTFGLLDTTKKTTPGGNSSYALVRSAIPHLVVTEIRLNDKLTQKGIMFSCIGKMFQAGSSLATNNSGLSDIGAKISKGFQSGLDALCKATIHMSASEWLAQMSSGSPKDLMATRIGGLAYAFIRNSASGEYMNTYELPHFANDQTFMTSIGYDGFDTPGQSGNPFLKLVNDMTGGNLVMQQNISWAAKSFTLKPFTGTFYVFNDTLDMYASNLDFILRFVTHSMPIRDSFMYRAPCCYDVTDVGNRRCYFCSGDFTVKKVGKIRLLKSLYACSNPNSATISDSVINRIKERIITKEISSSEINSDLIKYVPDAFEISYTFTPIISENYNTFVYYFLQQSGNPSESVLPGWQARDENNNKVGPVMHDYTSTKYGKNIDYLDDKLMKMFVDAFSKEVGGAGGGAQ